jgi:putative Mn2+ efflux pump MntP
VSVLEIALIGVGLAMDAFAVSVTLGLSAKKLKFADWLMPGAYFGFFQAMMPTIGFFLGFYFAGKVQSLDHWIAFALLCLIGGKMVKDSLSKDGGDRSKGAGGAAGGGGAASTAVAGNAASVAVAGNATGGGGASGIGAADSAATVDNAASAATGANTASVGGAGESPHGAGGAGSELQPFRFAKMLVLAFATSIDALAVGITFAFFRVNIARAALMTGAITFFISTCGVAVGRFFGARFKSKAEFIGGLTLILIGVKIVVEHLLAQ